MKTAQLFRKLPDQNVECTACAWHCPIKPGQTGICATRLNREGVLYSLVYGHPTGLALDPIEKKPLHHFLPGTTALSFGTVGCNFGCLFCQNAWMSQASKVISSGLLVGGLDKEITEIINKYSINIKPEEIVDKALEVGAKSIAYTYNEPTIFVEFAHDTAVIARKKGLKNVFVSNGYQSVETFDYMKPYLDAINIDLKSFQEDYYRNICKAKLGPVLANIKRFFEAGIETEVTTLVVPGKNDSQAEFKQIAEYLVSVSPDIPWHVTAFHPDWKMYDIADTPKGTLVNAYKIGKDAGLKYVYVGNISDDRYASTYCPKCQTLLIKRNGYDILNLTLDSTRGKCRNCGEEIYGTWN